jgi:hypothetical protein
MSVPNVVMGIAYAPHEDDLGTLSKQKQEKYGRERKFYSANGEKNYVSYVNDGAKSKIDYVAYSGDSEKSYGTFDQNGQMTKHQQFLLKEKLRSTKSVIWHGYISFTTEFGNKYLKTQADAMRLMNAEFPRFFKNAGLNPENITWYAGLHENTLHKHIHFSFYENEPMRFTARDSKNKRYSEGQIPSAVIARFKVAIEQRLTDATAELKAARQRVTDIMQNVLFSPDHKRRLTKEKQEQIAELAKLLPDDGRLSYASENMAHLRPMINGIVDTLIKSSKPFYNAFNAFCNTAVGCDERTKKMLAAQKIDKRHWDKHLIADKVLDDMYRRLGNYVINTARMFKDKVKPSYNRNAVKRMRKQSTASLMKHCLNLSAHAEREAMDFFREYMAKLKEEEFKNAKQNDKEQPQNEIEIE